MRLFPSFIRGKWWWVDRLMPRKWGLASSQHAISYSTSCKCHANTAILRHIVSLFASYETYDDNSRSNRGLQTIHFGHVPICGTRRPLCVEFGFIYASEENLAGLQVHASKDLPGMGKRRKEPFVNVKRKVSPASTGIATPSIRV